MDTTTESPRTPRLASVQDLLTELDRMKTTGIGARERLDFMLARGAELVESDEFPLEDAFDLEARVRVKRLDQLDHLAKTMNTAKGLWSEAPLKDDIKQAAKSLFRHLDGFINDARRVEEKSNIEMLSQIWVWEPDLRWLYPWLTAWTGPIYRPSWADNNGYPVAPAAEEPSEEVKEFAEAKQKLYDETTPDQTPVELHEPEPKETAKLFDLTPEQAKTVEERIAEKMADVKVDPHDIPPPKEIPDEVVVASIKETGQGPVVGRVHPDEVAPEPEPDRLRRDNWTTALRLATTMNWTFSKEQYWMVDGGEVLIWRDRSNEARVEFLPMGGDTLVSLRIRTDEGFCKHEQKLGKGALRDLNYDPLRFVERALES